MKEDKGFVARILSSLLATPGHIDDVARRMIELARLEGESSVIECTYGEIVLHARSTSSTQSIRAQYERDCYSRLWPRMQAAS